MEALWSRRSEPHNLVGTTINVNNGNWVRQGMVSYALAFYYDL